MELEMAKAKLAKWAEGTEFELANETEKKAILEELREAIWVVLEEGVVHIPLNLLGGGKDEKNCSI